MLFTIQIWFNLTKFRKIFFFRKANYIQCTKINLKQSHDKLIAHEAIAFFLQFAFQELFDIYIYNICILYKIIIIYIY